MKKTCFLLALCCLLLGTLQAQLSLHGKVTTADGKPVPAASVFLSNTSFGTAADANGQFIITQVPPGKYELIVSSMGFETQSKIINTANFGTEIIMVLQPKAAELEEVVVGSYERETWEKWGRFFLENFIGTTSEASQCILKNNQTIRFRNYSKRRKLIAMADQPLIIENRALGYRIKYQMEMFEYDFKTKILIYAGYPLFEPMEKAGKLPKAKWANNREKVYYGSKMHFMRCLYRNTLSEEGFAMHNMTKIPNTEKERIRRIMQTQINRSGADSSVYFERILQQPDEFVLVDTALLTGDSVAFAINETTAGLYFPDYLQIIYTLANEDPLFLRQQKPFGRVGKQTSSLQILRGKPVEVLANGAFFEPLDILIDGYWSWSDKMGNMLPFDYKPPIRPLKLSEK